MGTAGKKQGAALASLLAGSLVLTACSVPAGVNLDRLAGLPNPPPRAQPLPLAPSASSIKHLVVILQENHSFDHYFGRYCLGQGQPSCVSGRACCGAAPTLVITSSGVCEADKQVVSDQGNADHDPPHHADSQYTRMHLVAAGFAMDRYPCRDVAYAPVPDESYAESIYPDVALPDDHYLLRTYHNLAHAGALADRYFQPIIGASSSNDMFFARAAFVFQDNQAWPRIEAEDGREYVDQTIGDRMDQKGVTWGVYMEGYDTWLSGRAAAYPAGYDPTDNPFSYYRSTRARTVDYARFADDAAGGRLPAVSLVRGLGRNSEHPGEGTTISDGEYFVRGVLDAINRSVHAPDTLILITWDESGGFFDHVPPPLLLADGTPLPRTALEPAAPADMSLNHRREGDHWIIEVLPRSKSDPEYFSNVDHADGQEYYGPRLPLLALGRFARRDFISHVVMEHSSIVKFIEWNWLGDDRIGTRDDHVNGLGSLLDPATTGAIVPQ